MRRYLVFEGGVPDDAPIVRCGGPRLVLVDRPDELSRAEVVAYVPPRKGCTCGGCMLRCAYDDPTRETTIDDIPKWPS